MPPWHAGEWDWRQSSWHDEAPRWQEQLAEAAPALKDKYRNVSSLGCPGKHPLPLEDRKELLLCLATMLAPELVLSKIAVAGWTAVTTMAAFWLISRAGPKMSLRTVRNEQGAFVIRDAARILAAAATSLSATEEDKTALMQRLVVNCWEGHSVIVEEAIQAGFDPQEAEERAPGEGGKGQGAPRLPASQTGSVRVLQRSTTNEEIERLERRKKLLTLRLEVQAGEAEVAPAGAPDKPPPTGTPGPTWQQKAKQNMGEGVRASLAQTLPHEALHGQRSSQWAAPSFTNCGPPPGDGSEVEALASRAARFEGKVAEGSAQFEQWRNEWWEAQHSQSEKWEKQKQRLDEPQALTQGGGEWHNTPASGGVERGWQAENESGRSDGGQDQQHVQGFTMPAAGVAENTMEIDHLAMEEAPTHHGQLGTPALLGMMSGMVVGSRLGWPHGAGKVKLGRPPKPRKACICLSIFRGRSPNKNKFTSRRRQQRHHGPLLWIGAVVGILGGMVCGASTHRPRVGFKVARLS